MATYAIGDIQGCARTFEQLLETIGFDGAQDHLWLVGDLVNRGPASVEVLRWVRSHERCVTAVLGNHDLHLLGRAFGVAPRRGKDTIEDVLEAPDRDELIEWLRRRPLMHREGEFVLVHAGLLPSWTLDEALTLARDGANALRGPDCRSWLERWSHKQEARWQADADGDRRTETAVRVFCNLRGCDPDGQPIWTYAGPPALAPEGLIPWYDHPSRIDRAVTVVCGHWAAQGLVVRPDMIAVDTGCVWGNRLTAVRLEDRAVFSEPLRDEVPTRRPTS